MSEHSQHQAFLAGDGGSGSSTENNSVIPAYFLSGDEARSLEPDLSGDVVAALLVTETGIVDSAGVVDSLAREIEEADYLGGSHGASVGVGLASSRSDRGEGMIVRGTRVVRVDKDEGGGWVVQLETGWGEGAKGDVEAVKADVVVNAAGLNATSLLSDVLPEQERMGMWISKGG